MPQGSNSAAAKFAAAAITAALVVGLAFSSPLLIVAVALALVCAQGVAENLGRK